MEIKRTATAGTLESNDALVQVSPAAGGLSVELNSIVEKLYGDHIVSLIHSLAESMDVHNARIVVEDRGALDFAIEARVEAALLRAGREDD